MYQRKRVTAVVLGAGSGSRMGAEQNKVLLPLGGRPVIWHALHGFAAHPYVDDLVLVTRERERAEMTGVARGLSKPCRIVLGGETRQASVSNAIADLKSEIVAVHDGARPLVRGEDISACVEALSRYDGAIVATEVEEEICFVKGRWGRPKRLDQSLYAAQTPQCFHLKVLRACHDRYRGDSGITDDSQLLELQGHRVGIVVGDPSNLKITTPLDLLVAEAYLAQVADDGGEGVTCIEIIEVS